MSAFADFRALVAGALTDLAPVDDNWPVHDAPADAVTPPCFVLVWPDPWLTPLTVCSYVANLDVICVAARIDPAPGYLELEALITAAIPALRAARVPFVGTGGAQPFEVAGLTYQSARVHVSHTVTFPEVS